MDYAKLLKEAEEKRAALLPQIRDAKNTEELDKLELEKRRLDSEIKMLKELVGQSEDPAARSEGQVEPQGQLNPLATFRTGAKKTEENEDVYSSLEYRQAFRNYVVSGTPIPEKFRQAEERADALTVVGDVTAVIPTTILNKVIEDLTIEGKVIKRITQTSFQGGIQIPISEIKPTATWLGSEEAVSDEQKALMEAKLSFAYHVLEAKVAIGLLTSTVTLQVFEATVVKQLKKAMIDAIETAVAVGTGVGQPLGFTKYTLPAEQVISFTAAQVGSVKGWARAEAAIPEAYEDGEVYLMNKQTWEMHLNSMVDSAGQKIGLGKINEKGQKILNGREVITIDKLPGYDNAAAGDVFGVLINLEDYIINSNLNMYYKKYYNEDKNKWIHKALMIADGKMAIGEVPDGVGTKLVGAKGLIYLTKA
ncbi:phage major capsid protein [Mobilitalea sibirica]|uniref:Phage major capsid protein n=1 Tax=Mobilitalea sibirica TaxID=1462919 RepID=A0A8J7H3P7_9FIRM|nr:phage major capsid protein [Mobilitalea sibirica]MBH1941640.1 phage major capsid protein [Mobilitalea sibirica]